MRKKRYIEKLELFEREMEFIKSHDMSDEITERALLYSLQVCVDIATDVVAMLTKDMGLAVEDDYTNIAKLEKEGALKKEDSELIRKFNGIILGSLVGGMKMEEITRKGRCGHDGIKVFT